MGVRAAAAPSNELNQPQVLQRAKRSPNRRLVHADEGRELLIRRQLPSATAKTQHLLAAAETFIDG